MTFITYSEAVSSSSQEKSWYKRKLKESSRNIEIKEGDHAKNGSFIVKRTICPCCKRDAKIKKEFLYSECLECGKTFFSRRIEK